MPETLHISCFISHFWTHFFDEFLVIILMFPSSYMLHHRKQKFHSSSVDQNAMQPEELKADFPQRRKKNVCVCV